MDLNGRGFTPRCGIQTRDRLGTAWRSLVLSDNPLMDIPVDDCQGIVELREGDLDYDSNMFLMPFSL
jgi:hypothetical protein